MEQLINVLFLITAGLWDKTIERLSDGGMGYVDGMLTFSSLLSVWAVLGIIGASIIYSAVRFVQGKSWFIWDDISSETNLIHYMILLPLLSVLVLHTALGVVGFGIIIVVNLFAAGLWLFKIIVLGLPVLLPIVGVISLLWAMRWVNALRKAVVVHTMDKDVHVVDGKPLEKTGLDGFYTPEEIAEAKRILESVV